MGELRQGNSEMVEMEGTCATSPHHCMPFAALPTPESLDVASISILRNLQRRWHH